MQASAHKYAKFLIVSLSFLLIKSSQLLCQEDKSHFSKVFDREKPYRIFLPSDYATSMKHYPVIYYFHGNTGIHELDIPGVEQLVKDGSPFRIRFNLTITDNKKHIWHDEFDAPVYFDVPEFTEIGIDDGDSEIFGSGNGNNIAEPGETVMIYEISSSSRRLRLYYDDPYIDREHLYDEIQPDKWGDGYSLSSLIHISNDCPHGHQIKFLACYEVKDWKLIKRTVTWGEFVITVGD